MGLSSVDQVYLDAGKTAFQPLGHRLCIGSLGAGAVVESNDGPGAETGQVQGGP